MDHQHDDGDIERRLQVYLVDALARPFDWAVRNCCHLGARWVAEVEGRDPMAGLPATPDARSARVLLARLGGLAAAWTRQLGRDPVAGSLARVGDLVAMPMARLGGRGDAVGICCGLSAALGESVAVFIDEQAAAVFWPTAEATHCWPLRPAVAP